MLESSPSEISKAVVSLESAGVVVSSLIGGTRIIALNKRWFAASELRTLLERLSEGEPELSLLVSRKRTRPRRIGKSL